MKILYIEDNPVDASVTAASIMLALPSSQVDLAYSLAEADRRLAELGQYDVVLLDLDLPDGPGIGFLQSIRASYPDLPVIILSGLDSLDDSHAAFRAGADQYVVKQHHYLRNLPAALQQQLSRARRSGPSSRPQPLHVLYLDRDAASFHALRQQLARLAPHIKLTHGDQLDAVHTVAPKVQVDIVLVAYDSFGSEIDRLASERGAATCPLVLLTDGADAGLVLRTRGLRVGEYLLKHARCFDQLPMTLEAVYHRAALVEREAVLQQTVHRLQHLLDSNPTILYSLKLTTTGWTAAWVSNNVVELLGYPRNQVLTPNWWFEHVHPEDQTEAALALELTMKHGVHDHGYRFFCADGSIRRIRDQLRVIRDGQGAISEIVGSWNDVTDLHVREAQLASLSRYDPLTGLANRWSFECQLAEALANAAETSTVGLILLDLVGFHAVNASFGMTAGDAVLKLIAQRISTVLSGSGSAARTSGDEFAILIEEVAESESLRALGRRLIEQIGQPITLSEGIELRSEVRIGISCARDTAKPDAAKLIQQADSALNHAKGLGKGGIVLYEERLTQAVRERTQLANRLRRAIEADALEVWYQPKVDIRTGAIAGVEALARWRDDELGQVPPDKFIEIAETFGLIDALGMQILYKACEDVTAWCRAGLPAVPLSVNVSPLQLERHDLTDRIAAALRKTGFPAERLELELTESALMRDVDSVVTVLQNLRSLGIHIALDDFGKGYSSLGYLTRFPIDTLKIDKRFVAGIPNDASDCAIATAIVQLGRSLGYRILAEGVETEAQLAALQELGCDLYQGFLFSRPIPAAAMATLLGDARKAGRR